jgi:hypothetical protein
MANTEQSASDEGGDKGAVDLAIHVYNLYHQFYIYIYILLC